MVPHSWILKYLEMVGAAKNMISVMSNSMVNWKTVLPSGWLLGRWTLGEEFFKVTTVYSDHDTLDPSTMTNESWIQTGKGHEAH